VEAETENLEPIRHPYRSETKIVLQAVPRHLRKSLLFRKRMSLKATQQLNGFDADLWPYPESTSLRMQDCEARLNGSETRGPNFTTKRNRLID
jgi:hypothetical protein